MPETPATLDQALAEAHLPALVLSLVHLTGDASLLTTFPRPVYDFFAEGKIGGYSAETQGAIRAAAKAAIEAHQAGKPLAASPSQATVRKMMDFVAGVDIPEHYGPFLMEELGLNDVDAKKPDFEAPRLRAAAAKMKVVVIGAGMSGILTGIRLKQAGIDFTIIEKNADVGGTWLENTYPGCRVDNPSHLYSFSFEPNHAWPEHFSPQPVLLAYFKGVADKHGLRPHIRFETTAEEARFDERTDRWSVQVRSKDGRAETLDATAVITAVGQLNQPRYPDIEGRETFAGPAFHSARWNHDLDFRGKRVAIIGTGASAFQFGPEIAPDVEQLTIFQRTPPWLAPTPDYHDRVGPGERWLLQHVPYYEKWYRFWLYWMLTDGIYEGVKADPLWNGGPSAVSEANAMLREALAGVIRAQAPDAPELVERIIPTYPFGGKRALRDDGLWIGALKRDNVELVTDAVTKITPAGVITKDGTERDFDVIIYGTGFHASRFLFPMKIYGRGGHELREKWHGDPRAYLGMTTPGFPNLFMLYGPNTNIVVNGSIIFFSECSVRYVVGCLRLLADTGSETMEVKSDVHDAFNVKVDAANQLMAWGSPHVNSWYKNEAGRVTQNWPFPLVDYWQATVAPNPDDFILRAKVAAEA
jgi:4-hydroxyacetophenone monooxygenase